jgi:hypothetical protein
VSQADGAPWRLLLLCVWLLVAAWVWDGPRPCVPGQLLACRQMITLCERLFERCLCVAGCSSGRVAALRWCRAAACLG